MNMMPKSKILKKDKQELLNFSRAFDVTQLIKEPTRVSDTRGGGGDSHIKRAGMLVGKFQMNP